MSLAWGYYEGEDWYDGIPQGKLKRDKLSGKTTHLGTDDRGHHYFYTEDPEDGDRRIDITGKSQSAADLHTTFSWDKDSGEIGGVSTHPGFRGRGYAERALSVAHHLSAQNGWVTPKHAPEAWRSPSGNRWAERVGDDEPDRVEIEKDGKSIWEENPEPHPEGLDLDTLFRPRRMDITDSGEWQALRDHYKGWLAKSPEWQDKLAELREKYPEHVDLSPEETRARSGIDDRIRARGETPPKVGDGWL